MSARRQSSDLVLGASPMEKKDAPTVLGDFEIVRLIGRGGMGVVYEAHQRSLNRRVALKVLASSLGLTRTAITRFRREAEAAILRGDFPKARELQEVAGEQGATRYWDRFTDGQIELYQGDYREAVERLQAALKEQPDSIPAKSLLAVANLWSGNEPAYFQALREIEDYKPLGFDDCLYLGFINIWQHPDKSLEWFECAEKESPNQVVVQVYRAQASRLYAMMIGNDPQMALSHATDAIASAEVSQRMLKDSPVAAAELALSNLVAWNLCKSQAGQASPLSEPLRQNSQRYLNAAREGAEALKRFRLSSDAAYARFLLLAELDDESGILELIGELDRRNTDLNPYLFQLAGTLLFQMDNPEASLWLESTPGLQGRSCQFMEFFLEMCQPGFSCDSRDIRGRVRRYIDEKISDGNPAYLEVDRCIVALLDDPQESARVLEKVRQLQIVDHVYDDVYRYLSKDGIATPKELLERCKDDNRKVCETCFFLAVEALCQGDRQQAKAYFRLSLEANMFPFYLHWWSRALLKHMERNSTWPDWLPSAAPKKAISSPPGPGAAEGYGVNSCYGTNS
ncbi:MAG: hypothetical protein ACYC6Y_10980 [Thermoguttaceae bacterium]